MPLVAQAFENPPRRVTLLGRRFPVLLEKLLDPFLMRPEFPLRPRLVPAGNPVAHCAPESS
jgi:hypothetical protein